MSCLTPAEILEVTVKKGVEKANSSPVKLLTLSFLAGMYISLGFLAYLRIAAGMPAEWGSLPGFIGSCIFPVGLVAVILAGGELITGNMLVVATAWFKKAIPLRSMLYNWVLVTFGNLLGALFTAYFLGHLTGLTEGAVLEKTLAIASGKISGFVPAFFSAIGCNIFVGLGVWQSFGAKDSAGKILAIWFPVTTFVAIGFQHVVANMFIIPAAIFSGASTLTWADFLFNQIPVWLGNAVGGALILGLIYCVAYAKREKTCAAKAAPSPSGISSDLHEASL